MNDVLWLTFLGALNFVCWGNAALLLFTKPASDVDYSFLIPICLSPPFVILVTAVNAYRLRGSDLATLTARRTKTLYAIALIGLLPFALLFMFLMYLGFYH